MPKPLLDIGAPSRPLFIFNPQAGGATALADLESRLRERFPTGSLVRPADARQAVVAIESRDRAVDAIVIGGGDGSISGVLAPLLESGLPLGVLPLGTANDFARSLGVPDVDGAIAAIAGGRVRRVDVGEANGRLFLNTIAIGLPAAAARGLTSELKKRLGMLAAAAVIPRIIRRGRSFEVELVDETGTLRVEHCIAVLAGAGSYVGGLPVSYDDLDDGQLHVIAARARSWWEAFSILGSALVRRLPEDWNVTGLTTAACNVRTSRPLDVALDGDIVFKTPVDLRVRPAALRVFAP
jgi:YegS/Rv2252/BmrU family lipid kinase